MYVQFRLQIRRNLQPSFRQTACTQFIQFFRRFSLFEIRGVSRTYSCHEPKRRDFSHSTAVYLRQFLDLFFEKFLD